MLPSMSMTKIFTVLVFVKRVGSFLNSGASPLVEHCCSNSRNCKTRATSSRHANESTYIGYSLHRVLVNHGIDNEIIASSLIPTLPGKKVKTDRVDATRLAVLYAKDDLKANPHS